MNNAGNFSNGPPAALMSYPFPLHNPLPQHPPLMEQGYSNQPTQHYPVPTPRLYNPRPTTQTPRPEKRKQEVLTCDTCGIEVNSQQMMDAHIRGQKHIKKMKLKAVSATDQPPEDMNVDSKPPAPVVPSTTPTVESTSLIEPTPSAEPVVKSSTSSDKSVLQTMNELAKFNKVNAQYNLIKETGPAHCKQFEVRLTLGEENYIGTGTSIKRAQQVAAEQALLVTALHRPESSQRGSHSSRLTRGGTGRGVYANVRHPYPPQQIRPKTYPSSIDQQQQQQPASIPQENHLQNLINNKCAEISEDEHTILVLHRLVDDIERALKTASDKLMGLCKINKTSVVPQLPDDVKLNNIEQPNEDPNESFRMLKGAMKVSTLAMRLFLKNDREYALVLICANKPTVALLNDICQELNIGLNAQAIAAIQLETNDSQSTPITYQVEINIADACLSIQSSHLPRHTIRIMLTSPVFRSENFLNLDDQTRQQIAELNPDPNDMLDKSKCLEAAAEIRHSNWFTRCMLEHNPYLVVLRLLRDLQHQQTPLSSLNLWCLTLLVYKCQNQPPNSPMHLFRSVFSCLSSGILLQNHLGTGIIDPCEKDLTDAASYLTDDQRFALTNFAHHILRLLAFEKYDQIFQTTTNQIERLTDDSTMTNPTAN